MNIIVLAGGYSPERDVSLTSGSLIANALIANGHSVLLLDLYVGLDTLPHDLSTLFCTDSCPAYTVGEAVPDLAALKESCGNGDALIGKNVLPLCQYADLVFLALHGGIGENGQLQATLDNYGIKYTGSGYVGSLLAMDKDLAKRLLRGAGVRTPDWICLRGGVDKESTILEEIGLPCVVKPASCGSSVGVSIVETREELTAALAQAAEWDTMILVEKKITGRELTVGILDGECLPPVEIIPETGFYDYKNKYQGCTREVCPAPIPERVTEAAYDLTRRGFEALRLGGYARFDFLLDADGALWCLEANTLPGMTPTSLLPQSAAAVGISYNELCERIVKISL